MAPVLFEQLAVLREQMRTEAARPPQKKESPKPVQGEEDDG